MGLLGHVHEFPSIIVEADGEADPLPPLLFLEVLAALVALHLHGLDPGVEHGALLLGITPSLLYLGYLVLSLDFPHSVLQDLPLEHCLQPVRFYLAVESFLQVLSVLLLEQLQVPLQLYQTLIQLRFIRLLLDQGESGVLTSDLPLHFLDGIVYLFFLNE